MNFAEAVREILVEAASRARAAHPGGLCRAVARETERYLDRVQFSREHYMRHPILLWDDWEVMLIAWEGGQITPIHDHRGVMGGMAMLSGTLAEERFTTPRDIPELDDSQRAPGGRSVGHRPDRAPPPGADDAPGPFRSTSTGRRSARWASGTRAD